MPQGHPLYNVHQSIETWYQRQDDSRFRGLKTKPQEIYFDGPAGIRRINLWTLKMSWPEHEESFAPGTVPQPDDGCYMMGSTPNPSAPIERRPRRLIDIAEDRREHMQLIEDRQELQQVQFGAHSGESCLSVWKTDKNYVQWPMNQVVWHGTTVLLISGMDLLPNG